VLISGTLIPAQKYLPAESGKQQERQHPESQRERAITQHRRQQTAEYIFRGELDEEQARQNASFQQIDPANINAISSYNDTAAASPSNPERKGQLLDIFL